MSKKILTGLALGVLTACSPSQKEIQQMIEDVPLNKRHSLVINYDKQLLSNIDSLVTSGKKVETAIEKAHESTWEQACAMMPKKSEWKGEEYVVQKEANEQLEKSRERKKIVSMVPQPVYNGKTMGVQMRPVVTHRYEYHPTYRDSLAKEIKHKEDSTKIDIISVLKNKKQNY